MDLDIFQQLSLAEVEQYSIELDHAVNNHAQWLNQINRTLICKLPPEENDLAENPHQLCHFGRWYHGIENTALEGLDSFQRIAPVHEHMHQVARELLQKAERNEPISSDEYDDLVEGSNILRQQLYCLRNDLNRNRDLISRLMGKVFENADEGVIITDPNTTIVSVNKAFSQVTGYSPEEAIGQTPKLFNSGRQGENFYRHMWTQLQEHGQWQGEIWNRNKAGEDYLEWLSIAAVRDENGELSHYIAIFSDITSEKENEERLHNLAHYDQLTGLPNRILFNERLRYALTQAERNLQQVAVMFLDLDGFKPVNDNLGHAAGDRLLHLVAQRLKHCLRASDTVARFGGDEFTIVLPDIDNIDSVAPIAEKIIQDVARPYELDGNTVQITTSVGISICPRDCHSAHELIHHADNAMYQAKRHGKNQYRFYQQES
jgi:diguanylate cyclase (GGDEF)-like protein/PAS domain S-box-containing protein